MKTRVIGIFQLKGGVGRSTVSTNLAGELSRSNSVALIDCDMPQATSTSWYVIRNARKNNQNLSCYEADSGEKVNQLIETLSQGDHQVKYIILDSPPRITDIGRAITVDSDLLIIPIGASLAEIWASEDVKTLLKEAGEYLAKPVNARLLWTRYRDYTNLAKSLHDSAEEFLAIPSMQTTLGYRVAYAEALGAGMTVGEFQDKNAQREIASLTVEVKKLLKKWGV